MAIRETTGLHGSLPTAERTAAGLGVRVLTADHTTSSPLFGIVFVSLRKSQLAGDDPWGGNSLEWATSSPPPHHNFHHLPAIHSERPVFDLRHAWTTLRPAATPNHKPPPNAANIPWPLGAAADLQLRQVQSDLPPTGEQLGGR